MNKKTVIGCLSVFGVLFVGALVFFYFSILRPAEAILDDLDTIAEMPTLNENIRNLEAFVVPEDENLTPDQLERFARVQSHIRTGLGADHDLLRERAQSLIGIFEVDGVVKNSDPSLREAIFAFDGLGDVLYRAKELQVEALNREGFSQDEYRWVRETTYQALGFSRADLYLEDFAQSMKEGKYISIDDAVETDPSAVNRDLASLYSDMVEIWHPFLVFGL